MKMATIGTRLAFTMALAIGLAGCEVGPKSGRGFTLPEGDSQLGKELFVELSCNDCHTVKGVEGISQPEDAQFSLALGGSVERVQTYGELVTAIINPSHKFAKGATPAMKTEEGDSKMRDYNSVITIEELTHLVTFLQDQYELVPYEVTHYHTYP